MEVIKWYGKKVLDKATAVNFSAMKKAALMVERDVKLGFQKTGSGREYKRGGKIHKVSRSGEYPAVDTGALRASIQNKVYENGGNVIGMVGTDLKYGLFLEVGTHNMQPRPFLRRTVIKDGRKITKIFKDANK